MAEGLYVVKTVTNHPLLIGRTLPGNTLEASLHYNDKGKAVWSCSNQIVVEYLAKTEGQIDHYYKMMTCEECTEFADHEIHTTEKYTFCSKCGAYTDTNDKT